MSDDEEIRERRRQGEQVTRCPVCGKPVADALMWGHEEAHARRGERPAP